MASTITLIRYQAEVQSAYNTGQQVWPLKLIAQGKDITDNIFVYQIKGTGDPFQQDIFRCVASVHDLYEFPVLTTISTDQVSQIPYYRTNTVTLFCRSAEELEQLWADIQADVDSLIKNYNADARLKAIDQTIFGDDVPVVEDMKQYNQYNINLDFRPAGDATADVGNNQTITPGTYDANLSGWLPVSEVPGTFIADVPVNAKYFYNISKTPELAALFPLQTPLDKHLLFWNGAKLPYGQMYTITADTIYWIDFEPNYYTEFFHVGDAPWQVDYVDRTNTGTLPVNMSILIFAAETI